MLSKKTIIEIQKFIPAVQYISNLPIVNTTQKNDCEKILNWFAALDTNIANPMQWNIFLDIVDEDIMYGLNNKSGYYKRTWQMSFEFEIFEITAKTIHTDLSDNGLDHHGTDYSYEAMVLFKSDESYFSDHCTAFVTDLQNHKNYITNNLNHIEIDIEVF